MCCTWILQLLTTVAVLLINVFGHEFSFLSLCHLRDGFNFRRLNKVVIPYFLRVEEHLSLAAILLL